MTENGLGKRPALDPWDIGFSAAVFVSALLAIFVWFPNDIRTGFFQINVIGKEEPGDAFFPILLATTIALLAVLQLALSFWRGSPVRAAPHEGRLTAANFRFLLLFGLSCTVGLAVMYGFGPVTVWVMNGLGLIDAEYRNLSATVPYKYLGYVFGGFLMTIGQIVWTEGRLRRQSIAAVVIVLVSAIVVFDVLLKNVLLPPNADF